MAVGDPFPPGVRDRLLERNLIEEHAVRLGATRWSWHPILSFRAMRGATWTGQTDPATVVNSVPSEFGTYVPARDTAGTLQLAHPDQRAIEPPPDDVPAVPGPDAPDVPAAVPPRDGVPGPDVPAPGMPGVPGADVPAAEPEIVPVHSTAPETGPGPDTAGREQQQETEREEGVTVNLSADATLPAKSKRPPQDVIDAAELKLASTPLSELPSAREVARDMLGDPNQRRLAARLLEARLTAGPTRTGPPAGETVQGTPARQPRPNQQQRIATPANHRIGGQAVG